MGARGGARIRRAISRGGRRRGHLLAVAPAGPQDCLFPRGFRLALPSQHHSGLPEAAARLRRRGVPVTPQTPGVFQQPRRDALARAYLQPVEDRGVLRQICDLPRHLWQRAFPDAVYARTQRIIDGLDELGMACLIYGGCVTARDGLAGLVAAACVDGVRESGHGNGRGGSRGVAVVADALVVATTGGDFVSVAADCARVAEIRAAVEPLRDAGRGA